MPRILPLKELQCSNTRRSNCWRKSVAGIAHAFIQLESNRDAASLSHAEWLAILLDYEATRRNGLRLAFGFVMPG